MDDSVKIKKNYKLMGTESDPVIIAQRLLNLYRQLHIFSPEKKAAYNQMLMEQTPEVKRTLGTLPGGIVVQQYLSDIEEEAGVTVESFDNEVKTATSDVNFLGESGGYRNTGQPAATVSVASSPEMIKEIANVFKEAMVASEKNRKEDTKELAQTIVALQSKMAQTMMSKPIVTSSGEIVSGYNPSQLEDAVVNITKAQSELIKELAHTQTQELSQLISNVLKEIQQMSTQSLIDAVQTVHRENIDFFKNQIFSSVSKVPMSETDKTVHVFDNTAEAEPISLDAYIDEPEQKEAETPETEKEQVTEEPVQETPQETAPEALEEDDGDYEWEYVEDDGTEETVEGNSEYEYAEDDGDYEWEYVEDDGSGETVEGDGEYEYVEDESATENNGEYEYVEEDNTEENKEDEYEYIEDDGSGEGIESDDEYEYIEDEAAPEVSDVPETFDSENNETEISDEAEDNHPVVSEEEAETSDEEFPDQIDLDDDFGLSSNDDI